MIDQALLARAERAAREFLAFEADVARRVAALEEDRTLPAGERERQINAAIDEAFERREAWYREYGAVAGQVRQRDADLARELPAELNPRRPSPAGGWGRGVFYGSRVPPAQGRGKGRPSSRE